MLATPWQIATSAEATLDRLTVGPDIIWPLTVIKEELSQQIEVRVEHLTLTDLVIGRDRDIYGATVTSQRR